MKTKQECIIGACEAQKICENDSTPKVITVNIETGQICNSNIEENNNEKDILKKTKNNFTEKSSTRMLQITKSENGVCGFHLTRTKWDPYPWISAIDADTPAETTGLKVGDCVLEVNGEDVLGLRITDIAKLVRAKSEHVTLLLWSAGCESKCDPESLCDGPMPLTLQRLSIIVQSILSIIECPVCLDTIPPPAMQCQNGHLLCVNCRIRAEKCPVCRDRYTPKRALIAEQIYAAITNAFNLCRTEDKLRQKLFGTNVKHMKQQKQQQQQQQQQKHGSQQQCEQQKPIVNMVTTSVDKEESPRALENAMKSPCCSGAEVCKSAPKTQGNGAGKERIRLQLPTNKFLTKLLFSKACSMDNLSSAMTTETTAQTQSTNSDGLLLSCPATPSTLVVNSSRTNLPLPMMSTTLDLACNTAEISNDMTTQRTQQSCLNQSPSTLTTLVQPNVGKCTSFVSEIEEKNAGYLDDSTRTNPAKNKIMKVNGMSKHFSLSTNDLLVQERHNELSNVHLTTAALDGFIMATKVKPQCTPNAKDLLEATSPKAQTIESPNCSLLILDKRSPQKRSTASNSSQCSDSDESINSSTSSGDDISLPSSSQITLSTTVKAPLHFPFPDLHTLSGTSSSSSSSSSSDAGNSIDDFLSTSTPSAASSSTS